MHLYFYWLCIKLFISEYHFEYNSISIKCNRTHMYKTIWIFYVSGFESIDTTRAWD